MQCVDGLVEEEGAVEGVALDGAEAGVADDAAKFFLGGAVLGAGGADDVFFEHDAADVVAAEAEAHLQDLQALRDPAGLHVFDVVEHHAGDGEGLEVLDGGGLFPAAAAESGVAGLEAPGDEGGEAAGLFLELANDFEVVDALLEGFADAEHHGGGGAHAELVGGAVDADPIFGAALEAGDALADVVVEDLCAAAGDGLEAGVAKTHDGVAESDLGVLGDGEDFAGGEAVEPDVGEALLDAAEEGLEPLDFEVGVDAALHEDAGAAHLFGFGDLVEDGVKVEDVAFGGGGAFERPVEGAEGAVLGAEVGVVDVAIDDVADDALGVEAAADGVSFHADADQIIALEAVESLFARDTHEESLRLCGLWPGREGTGWGTVVCPAVIGTRSVCLAGVADEDGEEDQGGGEHEDREDEKDAESADGTFGAGKAEVDGGGESLGGEAGEAGLGGGFVGLGADAGDLAGEGIKLGGHADVGLGDAAEVVPNGGGEGIELLVVGTALSEVFVGRGDDAGDVGEQLN